MSLHDVTSDFALVGGTAGEGGVTWKRQALPMGTARRALDAEIAGEGGKVIGHGDQIVLANGDTLAWTPPPETPIIPDLSRVKSLRRYFGQRGRQIYPAWLYHQDGRSRLVVDAKEAAEIGVVHRKATIDERNRYGIHELWDWEEGCQWRPNPWVEAKFDPKQPGAGKTVIYAAPDAQRVQSDLVASVAAAVASALKVSGPQAPANVDASQWDEFLAFQAWKKTQEVVDTGAANALVEAISEETFTETDDLTDDERAANALSPEQDRILWESEAKRLGIKIGKTWDIERLKAEVEAKLNAPQGS